MKKSETREFILGRHCDMLAYLKEEFNKLHLEIHALKVDMAKRTFNETQKGHIVDSCKLMDSLYYDVQNIVNAKLFPKKKWWRFWK